ncbi:protein translocase subunit SecF, partial [Mycobacterium sp. THU-M116]
DLALVQLIGIVIGTYSSIFFATPLLVTLRERTELVRTHTRRVMRRRGDGDDAAEMTETADSGGDTEPAQDGTAAATEAAGSGKPAPNKPAPGARPARPAGTRRPSGKRNAGRR